jgi:hypothetical protein
MNCENANDCTTTNKSVLVIGRQNSKRFRRQHDEDRY